MIFVTGDFKAMFGFKVTVWPRRKFKLWIIIKLEFIIKFKNGGV